MSDPHNSWANRVQALMPNLTIEQLELNQEGLVNDVVIVNRQWVFRFAKTKRAAEILVIELRILDLVRPHVELPVPQPSYTGKGIVVYPLLTGQPLLRENVLALDAQSQQRLADQLGAFLFQLHTLPQAALTGDLPTTLAPVTRSAWLDIQTRFQDKAYPLLLPHQIKWVERLFATALENPNFFDYPPTLIHGDLAPYHILFDPRESRIDGIIDFGVAGLGDPASDIGSLITCYGEMFVAKMQGAYPGLAQHLPRARFYAQSIELQWVLLGIETGEKFWFTAHIGGARDVQQ